MAGWHLLATATPLEECEDYYSAFHSPPRTDHASLAEALEQLDADNARAPDVLKALEAYLSHTFPLDLGPELYRAEGTKLGGNREGAVEVPFLPNRPLVLKRYRFDPRISASTRRVQRTIARAQQWSEDGTGPFVWDVKLLPVKDSVSLEAVVVMSSLKADFHPVGRKVAFGTGNELEPLRNLSPAGRIWVRDRMLTLLDGHPDGHPGNVLYRLSRKGPGSKRPVGEYYEEGDYVVEVKRIDPGDKSASERTLQHRTAAPAQWNIPYNRQWQYQEFSKALGLDPPAPDAP